MRTFKSLILTLLMLLSAGAAMSQVTTSSLTGVVSGSDGETLPGATVVAVHTETSSQYAVITDINGRYIIQGMKPGGPYEVTVQFVGMTPYKKDGIYLSLGETFKLNASLSDEAKELEEVVIVSKNKFDASTTAASSRVKAEDIENMPSMSHSIADAARLDPLITTTTSGAMSFAGVSNRYNAFQVDGAMNNDVFGLTANGSNGGQAGTQPISIETLDQIQVSVAPFDVRQSGFTGGSINAITKSGTNTLHGSVYYDFNNQKLIGKRYEMMNGENSEKYDDESEYRLGFTLGGPIVKNKLFFFANYEHTDKEYPNNYGLGATASKVDATEAQKILDVLKSKGYNDTFSDLDNYVKSDKAGIKLDWNISTKHKATVSWRIVNAKQLSGTSTAAYLNSKSYAYDFSSKTNTITAELQSRFGDKVSNELKASYVIVRDKRDPYGIAPMIQVNNVGGGSVSFGTERSSAANGLDQNIFTITDNLTLYAGKHTFTFGTHNEFYKFSNLFIQDAYGSYYFNTPDDFYKFADGIATYEKDGKTYNSLSRYRFGMANESVTGDRHWAAKFGAAQFGIYVQDKVTVSDRFDVAYGIRIDIPVFFDTPAENEDFNAYAKKVGWNVKTDQKLSSAPLWSPRAGFRYELDDNGNFVLRGGVGVFTGRIPFVWLSNSFSNTGIQLVTFDEKKNLSNAVLSVDPNAQNVMYNTLTASGNQTVNVFAENFKFAQSVKFNLGFDFKLGGIDWSAKWLLSKVVNDVVYRNWTRHMTGDNYGATYGYDFDDRPLFEKPMSGTDYFDKTLSNVYLLDNTNKGYSTSVSLRGSKNFNFGLNLSASYTFTRSKSVNSGGSSVAQSNYNYNYTYCNPNDPELGFSAYNIPHRITAAATYAKEYGGHWKSTITLIYTGTSGNAYSIYYYGDLNGEGSNENDLIYIPTDAQIDKMSFKPTDKYTEDQQRANMKAWIASEDYLADHRGDYFERYADNEKFENHFDFHFAQRFSFKAGKQTHAIELSFDVMNISNMFSTKWGRYTGSKGYYSPITYAGNGQYQFLHPADYNMRSYSDYYSRWRGQIGIKYIF